MKNIQYVVVKFEGNNKPYYFVTDLNVAKGDAVVVDTRFGMTVGYISDFTTQEKARKTGRKLKWVVQVVNTKAHETRVNREKELTRLENLMRNRINELNTLELAAILANHDDKVSLMFGQYVKKALEL